MEELMDRWRRNEKGAPRLVIMASATVGGWMDGWMDGWMNG